MVIEWEPTASVAVVRVATTFPLTRLRVPVPRFVAPSKNVIVPVGLPALGLTTATVEVRVTDWPKTDCEADELVEVAVFACTIFNVNVC